MRLDNIKIGLCVTGSFCNFKNIEEIISSLKASNVAKIVPIVSIASINEINRFSSPEKIRQKLFELTNEPVIDTISKAEPVGPKNLVDVLLVAPCSGNTIAKLANAITDTPVLMACKSHIRNNKPIVLAIATNDGLGANFENIGKLYNEKNIYFVPFAQDDYINKPKSLVCDFSKVVSSIEQAMDGEQIQPIIHKREED